MTEAKSKPEPALPAEPTDDQLANILFYAYWDSAVTGTGIKLQGDARGIWVRCAKAARAALSRPQPPHKPRLDSEEFIRLAANPHLHADILRFAEAYAAMETLYCDVCESELQREACSHVRTCDKCFNAARAGSLPQPLAQTKGS